MTRKLVLGFLVLTAMFVCHSSPVRSSIGARGKRDVVSLPYDAEVEYLQMSNVQYIDTGKTVSDKTEVEFWFYCDEYSVTFFPLFGVYKSDGYFGCQRNSGGSPYVITAWRGNSSKLDITGKSDSLKTGIIEFKNEKWGINGVYNSYPSSAFDSTSTAWYGRVNGISTFGDNKRMGYLKMWEEGVVVFDAIPVRFTNESSQSEGAMYDRVSGQLFRNAGTGSFVIGPDKE